MTLHTSGEAVGLPQGQMGNSEVGHLNLGAGRVVLQTLLRINKAIADGSFYRHSRLREFMRESLSTAGTLHIIGLLSPGGVHSHQEHIFALCRLAAQQGIKNLSVHAVLDGRDTAPVSAAASITALERLCADIGSGGISSLCGRYYAMDRDDRWERTEKAYRLMMRAQAERETVDAQTALATAESAGETDEFVKPIFIKGGAFIKPNDRVICANFRADRMRQLTGAMTARDFSSFPRPFIFPSAHILTMTEYDENQSLPHLYDKEQPARSLGEVLAAAGKTQLRLAETEKFAHVTYFFNGGREQPFKGEERLLIPSLRVATYDLAPDMRAKEITAELTQALRKGCYDFILCNYANGDMVGHTGSLAAAVQAVETLDESLGRLTATLTETGGEAMITADHGNCEQMAEDDGSKPHTAHTLNPVPLIYYGNRQVGFSENCGSLADIAPTILKLMNIPQPSEMTGSFLL